MLLRQFYGSIIISFQNCFNVFLVHLRSFDYSEVMAYITILKLEDNCFPFKIVL